MKRVTVFVVLMLSFAGGSVAWSDAGTQTPRVNRRQQNQVQRVRQGVRSGQLTRDERQIQRMKHEARSDGVVTTEERKALHQRMNDESEKIYDEKHDAATRKRMRRKDLP